MTPDQKTIVQASFALVEPIAETAGQLFYECLFAMDPSLRRMFHGNIHDQARKLMHVLAIAVKGLDRTEQLTPVLEDMGRRHVRYGVVDAHYDTVGAALIQTLELGLGPQFTPEVREAWTAVYVWMAGTMQRAAHDVTDDTMRSTAAAGAAH